MSTTKKRELVKVTVSPKKGKHYYSLTIPKRFAEMLELTQESQAMVELDETEESLRITFYK